MNLNQFKLIAIIRCLNLCINYKVCMCDAVVSNLESFRSLWIVIRVDMKSWSLLSFLFINIIGVYFWLCKLMTVILCRVFSNRNSLTHIDICVHKTIHLHQKEAKKLRNLLSFLLQLSTLAFQSQVCFSMSRMSIGLLLKCLEFNV